MTKKKKLFTLGTLTVGTMVVASPLSSIANETPVNEEGDNEEPLFGHHDPTVYDVPNNPDFVVNQSVEGSNVTFTWDEVENADRYFVAKLYQVDGEYVPDGDPQYVTEGTFEDTIDLSKNYLFRIAPEVDGELQLDYVAVVTVSASEEEPVDEEQPTEENNNEEETNEEPVDEGSNVNEGEPSDKEGEQPTDEGEPSEENTGENKENEEQQDLELTLEQLEQIDALAKKYAENIVESDQVDKLYVDLFNNLKNDSKFANDFRSFFYDEVVPFVEQEEITTLEAEINDFVLNFFNENEAFNKHFYNFLDGFEAIQPQLEPLVEDYNQLLAELVDESLLDEAKAEFDLLAEDYFYEASFNRSLEGLEFLVDLLEEPPVDDENTEDESKDETQDPKDDKNDYSANGDNQHIDSVGDENNVPEENTVRTENGDSYYGEGDVLDPSVPTTGDGSIQKVVSPLVTSMLALVVAFILTPNRKRNKA